MRGIPGDSSKQAVGSDPVELSRRSIDGGESNG